MKSELKTGWIVYNPDYYIVLCEHITLPNFYDCKDCTDSSTNISITCEICNKTFELLIGYNY